MRTKDHPIGIIDSGSGGFSVWAAITKRLPHESTLYIGDHAHLPYSEKSTQYIRNRICAILRYVRANQVKLAVIACNTATVAGIDVYRKKFPEMPIIGVVPVIKSAVAETETKHFIVLSTVYTANSTYQKNLIDTYAKGYTVYNIGCPNLVRAIEEGIISGTGVRQELLQVLTPLLNRPVDIIALGCTHYPFVADEIRAIVGKKVRILDSGGAVARHVERVLTNNKNLASKNIDGRHEFRTTGDPKKVHNTMKILLGKSYPIAYAEI